MRQKFQLTPNDPRYLEMTAEDMHVEFWADHYFNNPDDNEDENPDFDADLAEMMADAGEDQPLPDDFEPVDLDDESDHDG